MKKRENNFAFIDSQNVYKGTRRDLGWELDWVRFRVYLKHKYDVSQAYLFIGFMPEHNDIYDELQKAGFILKFKPVLPNGKDGVKGNIDADLVLQAARDAYENKFDKAVLVSSDGDYASLVKFLLERARFSIILSTHSKDKCSILLKRTGAKISYINEQRSHLESSHKEKAPNGDRTP